MPKKRLEQLAEELYENDTIRAAIIGDADKLGNRAKIENGELTLPSPQDADHWYQRETKQQREKDARSDQEKRIAALEEQLRTLTGG